MRFKLDIQCNNAAFEDNPLDEVVLILKRLIDAIEDKSLDIYPLSDTNGNRVGFAEFEYDGHES